MAHVTINDQTPRVRYTVGGTPDSTFNVPFEFFALTDIKVYKGSTLLTYTTDYTVTGVGSATDGYETGEVTLVVAASDTVVTVFRDVPYERTTDFPLTGAFNITALNTQLDKLTAQVQQVKDQADRSIRIPVTDSTSLTTQLTAATSRAGNVLSFDSSGNAVATIATTDVSTVAGIVDEIETLSAIDSEITTVAGISASVSTLATISANVTTVAGISGNVTTVASISSAVSNVSSISGDVSAVSAIASNVTAVAGLSTEMTSILALDTEIAAVAGDLTNIDAVSGDLTNIDAVAAALPDIEALLNGTVASVTAANGSVTVGGTSTNPTISRAALTGDVTASAGNNATTIANNAVTYAKLQDVSATARLIGRKTAGSGDPEEVTASEALDFIGSTRGSLLYRGASGWSALTPGTSGHVLKSNGVGADPGFGAVGGAWEFVSTVTLSNQATADFQSLTSGYDYLIAYSDVFNVSASGGEIGVRVEVGGSWLATSYESALIFIASTGSSNAGAGGATTYVQAAYNIGGATSRTHSGQILLIDPGSTAGYKSILTEDIGRQHTNNNYTARCIGGGMYTGGTGAVTGLRVLHSSANITGTFKLYRRARS